MSVPKLQMIGEDSRYLIKTLKLSSRIKWSHLSAASGDTSSCRILALCMYSNYVFYTDCVDLHTVKTQTLVIPGL